MDERQAGFADAGSGDGVDAAVVLVHLERGAVGADQDFRALRPQMGGDEGEPDVLADRHADLHAPKIDGSGQRAGGEQARSEEHTSELQSLIRTSYAVFCLKKTSAITSHDQ